MSGQLHLDDATLRAAGQWLLTAADTSERGAGAPHLSQHAAADVAGEINDFLRHLMLARLSLTDAARTACGVVIDLMHSGDQLDRQLSEAMSRGYAVAESR